MADDAPSPQPCAPCRGTGRILSALGGEPHPVPCPWCGGTGTRPPDADAQAGPTGEERARAEAGR